MDAIPTPSELNKQTLTVKELSELLNVSRKMVYSEIKKGKIPGATKLGSIYRIHAPTVLAWLATGQVRVSTPRRHK